MHHLTPIQLKQAQITGGFWADKQKLNRETTIFSVLDRYEETGRFEAFTFQWKEGSSLHKPHFFWDSDVAKWLEAACDICSKYPHQALKNKIEQTVDLIEQNQDESGYFNIYHTVVEPENRFQNRDHHELYCLGHLIEAAVAYQIAFDSTRFLDILDRYIDYVIRIFTQEKAAKFVTPGHEEIELALVKLYELTGKEKYIDLCMFFLDQRGVADETDQNLSWAYSNYNQSHLPVREQKEAFGHAVRACYLYTGMAGAAGIKNDEKLFQACQALFDDITKKKMYISGGIGSSNCGEAFTIPYDIPNDTAYNETCASIALYLFADRMKDLELERKYADVAEREMYNGILSGISLDGTSFFYENPLEINLSDRTRHTSVKEGDRLPIVQRMKNFGCSCCPPNMTRFLATVERSALSFDENGVYVHQFMSMDAKRNGIALRMQTDYPKTGTIDITLTGAKGKTLYVRIPAWCEQYSFDQPYEEKGGYAVFTVSDDPFTLKADYAICVRFYRCNSAARADTDKVAMMRGPVLYCMEAVDNQEAKLFQYRIDIHAQAQLSESSLFGLPAVHISAFAESTQDALYSPADSPVQGKPVRATFIPYYAFANRGESDMAVWVRKL